jgi:hypothetical protein
MNKKLKTFAIAILATGATVAATQATPRTNLVVLDNITVALKITQQGAANSADTTLKATTTSFTTADLIQNLIGVTSNFNGTVTTASASAVRTFKLVKATLYEDVLGGTPNTAVTNGPSSNMPSMTAVAAGGTVEAVAINGYAPLWIVDGGYLAAVDAGHAFPNAAQMAAAENVTITGFTADGCSQLPFFTYTEAVAGGNTAFTIANTNSYMVSNMVIYQSNIVAGVQAEENQWSLTNNIIISNGTTPLLAFTLNTNQNPYPYIGVGASNNPPFYDLSGRSSGLGYWTTIVPTNIVVTGTTATPVANASANIVLTVLITQYSPANKMVFTNVATITCVETSPGSGTEPTPVLYDVDSFVSWEKQANSSTFPNEIDPLANPVVVYQESGKDLSTSDFTGTNIAGQTVYQFDKFSVNTVWPTNNPAQLNGTTNIYLQGGGFEKANAVVKSLLVDATSTTPKESVQVLSSGTASVAGLGFIGGSFSTNYVTVVGSVTNTNYWSPGNSIGVGPNTAYVTSGSFYPNAAGSPGYYISGPIPVVFEGTITESFYKSFSAATLPFAAAPY